tara:strand:+ start:27 stop:548 length:522 start_codon:yes stop_codon:yes gene_type:complete
MIKSLKGSNGQIELHEDKVVIQRKGLGAKLISGAFTSGAKEIMIDSISGIQFKEAGITQGFIQFTIPGEGAGGSSSKSDLSSLFSSTGQNRQQDENTVTFNVGFKPKETNKAWSELKEDIQTMMKKAKGQSTQTTVSAAPSDADELEKFAKLKEQGIISAEEFDTKKKELLGL